ncbi:hypothetical protein, partial [Streptosporangium roseum]|uniref:hypothetical protein n=1 Tax=Streptosporangium roseum TaxID=2001 RepID=UPI0034358CF4
MPKNSSAARREQARALAAAEGITYTEALRCPDQARSVATANTGAERLAVVRKSKNRARRRQQSAPDAAYASANAGTAHHSTPPLIWLSWVICPMPPAGRWTCRWPSLARQAHEGGDGAGALAALERMPAEEVADLLDDALAHWAAGGADLTPVLLDLGAADKAEPEPEPGAGAAGGARMNVATQSMETIAHVDHEGWDDVVLREAPEVTKLPDDWWHLLDRTEHVLLCG